MTDNRQFDAVNQQVDELKDVMKDNIGKVIDRGEKLEDLESKANDLEQNVSIQSFVVARDGKKGVDDDNDDDSNDNDGVSITLSSCKF